MKISYLFKAMSFVSFLHNRVVPFFANRDKITIQELVGLILEGGQIFQMKTWLKVPDGLKNETIIVRVIQ